MQSFNNLFNQTQMINIPIQFICICLINLKSIRYHQGQPKPHFKQVQLTLLPFDLPRKVIFSSNLVSLVKH